MKKVNSYIFKGTLVTIIGIICILLCFIFGSDSLKVYLKGNKTIATVKFVRTDKSGTVVEYNAEGKNVVKDLKIYDTAIRPGSEMTIYYDKNDVEISYIKSQIVCCMMVMSISIVIFLSGLYFFIDYSKKRKEKEFLIENGRIIKANIVCVRSLKFTRFFKHHPFYVYATYKYEDDDYGFNSEETFYDLYEIIKNKRIKTVDVYVLEDDFSRYYVDIDKIISKM
ncbi:MAG: hypothetical protein OSJ70_05695 [Bacilli bacterium]|nr:hypothetical protein [Bacilli bacterium]